MKDFPSSIETYDGTRAMVFGASGFIGRWVARDLCARGARVALVVRDKRMAEAIFAMHAIRGDDCELDMQYFAAVGKLLKSVQPAIVFNLAGYGMDRAEVDDRTAYRINAHLLEVVIETLRRWQKDRTRNDQGSELSMWGGLSIMAPSAAACPRIFCLFQPYWL